jgi:aryl-alcohol dehydrogenase-like predicted oxidoreductase
VRGSLIDPHRRELQVHCYSILNRSIEREVLPLAQRFGMGTLVWGPLGQGMLTGRARKGRPSDLRRASSFKALTDERRLDAVERLIPLADEAGLPMTHLAMAFAIAHRASAARCSGRARWTSSTTCSAAST